MTIACSNCGAQLHPTGRTPRARCGFCHTDTLLDPATQAALAARGPVAPPEELAKVQAALSAFGSDGQKLLEALGRRLEAALPGQVQQERSGGLFGKGHVNKVVAQVGDYQYVLELGAHHHLNGWATSHRPVLRAYLAHIVGRGGSEVNADLLR